MDDHVDLLRTHPKKPPRLNHFEAFVHHCRGVNVDAVSHAPVGMSQRLLRGDARQRLEWRLAERAARSRQNKAPYFALGSAAQALMYGVVFTVYWQNFLTRLLRRGHDQLACRHQYFLVRERN